MAPRHSAKKEKGWVIPGFSPRAMLNTYSERNACWGWPRGGSKWGPFQALVGGPRPWTPAGGESDEQRVDSPPGGWREGNSASAGLGPRSFGTLVRGWELAWSFTPSAWGLGLRDSFAELPFTAARESLGPLSSEA